MNSKKTFSIGELAREFDLTTRSIRFYEDQQLLFPTRRGQTRVYSSQDRVRLKLILRGKRLGFSLAETRELFSLWDETLTGSEKQLHLLLEIIHQKRAELEQQLKDIEIIQQELNNAEVRCQETLNELKQKQSTDKAS
ncbi:MerR family transcriptional regulator [Neptuniibacter halophilus]|uniref:MerR family transcriptional regulator n=1 Tax=Neptuniibacter halophilus TaxID=651666 RepID=UPI002572E962|nr:MerR family DNA-binding transcriptional regulator [Neptuniibacter halophilus]